MQIKGSICNSEQILFPPLISKQHPLVYLPQGISLFSPNSLLSLNHSFKYTNIYVYKYIQHEWKYMLSIHLQRIIQLKHVRTAFSFKLSVLGKLSLSYLTRNFSTGVSKKWRIKKLSKDMKWFFLIAVFWSLLQQ